MTGDEKVLYLANVAAISVSDGDVNALEAKAIDNIRKEIGATEEELNKALTAVAEGKHHISPVGRFSNRVRNLEDMIYVCLSDGDLSKPEKPQVLSFGKSIGITQDQIREILSESKGRLQSQKGFKKCGACAKDIPSNSKFCPHCGNSPFP